MIRNVTRQNVNTVCQLGFVRNTTMITVIPFNVELGMVIVIQENAHLVWFVEVTIFWNTILSLLTVQEEK